MTRITTERRWQHYKTSPPTKIGFGTLVYLARKHSPGWSYDSAEAKFGETSATAEEQAKAKANPEPLELDDFYAYMPEPLVYLCADPRDVACEQRQFTSACSAGAEEGRRSGSRQEWKAKMRQS